MSDFDFISEKVSANWLTQVLVAFGRLEHGSVFSVRQTPFTNGVTASTGNLYRLKIDYTQGCRGNRPTTCLMKVSKAPSSMPGFDSLARQYASYQMVSHENRSKLFRKEVDFYRAIDNDQLRLPIPVCFGYQLDESGFNSVLLLDDLSATAQQPSWPNLPTDKQCESTIISMSQIHGYWWNHSRFGDEDFPAINKNLIEEVIRTFGNSYQQFIETVNSLSSSRRRICQKALEALTELMADRLTDSDSLTLNHGDAHHWNVLLKNTNGQLESTVLDWQTWHIDTPAHDLAYLMGVGWDRDQRARLEKPLLDLYQQSLGLQGIDYTGEQLWFDYRLSILRHLFTPIILSSFIMPQVWQPHIERVFSAYEDLKCQELLG